MKSSGLLIVISGFSGAGKGTLMKRLVEDYSNYALSVSMTTRPAREGEKDGREYFFTTKENFKKKAEEEGFIEYASYCGNDYGTPRDYVQAQLAAGKDVILEIEIQGAMQIKKKYPQALLLFVMPPSAEALFNRLKGRGTETQEVIRRRLERAVEESAGIENYDCIIVNDDLDVCVKELHFLLQESHHRRVEEYVPLRHIEFIEKVRRQLQELVKGEN